MQMTATIIKKPVSVAAIQHTPLRTGNTPSLLKNKQRRKGGPLPHRRFRKTQNSKLQQPRHKLHKGLQEVLSIIKTRFAHFNIQRFRCDNRSGEYDNQMFWKILAENGINFETSPPYTQNMNGVAERMIYNLNSRARSIMIDASIPLRFWDELINTATYL